eukprot:7377184-Prymnesium_polylepis.2
MSQRKRYSTPGPHGGAAPGTPVRPICVRPPALSLRARPIAWGLGVAGAPHAPRCAETRPQPFTDTRSPAASSTRGYSS